MSLGLALSGGGAKGAAHIGVLEALNDNNIKIDYISGTSSGSIIAALYAAGYAPNEILRILVRYTKNTNILDYDKAAPFKLMKLVFSKRINLSGFIKGDRIENLIRQYMNKKNIKNISDFNMPIAIPIVNVKTGEVVYYTNNKVRNIDFGEKAENENQEKLIEYYNSEDYVGKGIYLKDKHYDDIPEYRENGDIADIIRASISFPGVFRPKQINQELYIDGGVRVNTPVNILKQMGADKVIAVSFDCNKIDKNNLKNVVGITSQAFDILTHEASEQEQVNAEINVRLCTKNISLLDFSKSIYLARKGYNIVNTNINYIKEKLGI